MVFNVHISYICSELFGRIRAFHLYNDLFLLTICNFKTSCKYLRFPLAFSYLNINDSKATSRVIVIFDVCMFLSRRRFHTCRLSINWWSPLKEIILILLGNNQSRLHTINHQIAFYCRNKIPFIVTKQIRKFTM